MQTAIAEGVDCRIALENFLLSYRNTPHATTGKTPAELMFGRDINDKMPKVISQSVSDASLVAQDSKMNKKMKETADTSRKARTHLLATGDLVLLKNLKKCSQMASYSWYS